MSARKYSGHKKIPKSNAIEICYTVINSIRNVTTSHLFPK